MDGLSIGQFKDVRELLAMHFKDARDREERYHQELKEKMDEFANACRSHTITTEARIYDRVLSPVNTIDTTVTSLIDKVDSHDKKLESVLRIIKFSKWAVTGISGGIGGSLAYAWPWLIVLIKILITKKVGK